MTPWTPKKLAERLDVAVDENVRVPLRELRPERKPNRPWYLDRDDVKAVGRWNVEEGSATEEKLSEVLAKFDRDQAVKNSPFDVEPPDFDIVGDEGPVREVAARLLAIAREGGSILTDHDVWTDENIDVIVERFVKQPDVSGDGFFLKLDKQLVGVDDDVRLLFAEILLLQMLPVGNIGKARKIENIGRVLGGVDYTIPQVVLEAFDKPVFGGGVSFLLRRFQQMSTLIEFVRFFRALTTDERTAAVEDPLEWRKVVNDAPGPSEPSMRLSLLYMGHPEYFFPIVSEQQKEWIVEDFYPAETGRDAFGDVDVDLALLRDWMAPESGTTPDFYDDPLGEMWGFEDEDEMDGDDELDDELVDTGEYSVESIIEDGAFHPSDYLRSIVTRWKATKNVVLQGPPGTGKTWLARRLAYALIGFKDRDAVRSVQFHPGTSYEDFIRGWRPGIDGRLELVDGPLLQHAQQARTRPDVEHVVIIEEFNRGNPAQALGEMLTLLESTKRNDEDALELTYMKDDEQAFWLPENLYVIGTMNTADRSLALVDFALRRRFAFFTLEPQLNGAWTSHLKDRFRSVDGRLIDAVAQRVRAMNVEIAADSGLGPDFQIGHSFFVPEKEASEFEPWFRSVVESSVAPQLHEYWHDDPDTVDHLVSQLLSGI